MMKDYTAQVYKELFEWWSPEELPMDADMLRDRYEDFICDTTSEGFARDLALSLPIDFDAILAMVMDTDAKREGMRTFICFGPLGDFITESKTLVGAVQNAILERGGFAKDWTVHDLSSYPPHLEARLLREVRA